MKKKKTDAEETEILRAYARGGLKRPENIVEDISKAEEYARNTLRLLRKSKRINIRLSAPDLAGIQQIAAREGMPYQTLITSILHKYVAKNS